MQFSFMVEIFELSCSMNHECIEMLDFLDVNTA